MVDVAVDEVDGGGGGWGAVTVTVEMSRMAILTLTVEPTSTNVPGTMSWLSTVPSRIVVSAVGTRSATA